MSVLPVAKGFMFHMIAWRHRFMNTSLSWLASEYNVFSISMNCPSSWLCRFGVNINQLNQFNRSIIVTTSVENTFNPLATENTLWCNRIYEPAYITMHVKRSKHVFNVSTGMQTSSAKETFPRYSEANATEFQKTS